MGAVNIDNTGSGASVTLSSNGTQLLLNGSAVGGGASAYTISNKTGAYTVVSGDLGSIINCTSGAFTVSLTAAASLGAGFNCWIWNTSATNTDAITIDPSGAETINGFSTLILRPGQGAQIVCTGSAWQTDKVALQLYADNSNSNAVRPVASGDRSVAIHSNSTASGFASLAAGYICTASSSGALALGYFSTASGGYSTAISADATATYSTALGNNSGGNRAQAVTGSGSMALGGSYASGTDSFAAAVANNTSSYGATGALSVAIGELARANSSKAVSIGSGTLAGDNSVAIGVSAQASGTAAVAIGSGASIGPRATGNYSFATGADSLASLNGKYAYASGRFSTNGDAQFGNMVLRRQTADAVAATLGSDGAVGGASNQVILANNSASAFTGTVVARRQASGGTESAAWKIEGLIRREGTAASTTLVASTVTAISNVPGWTLALSADTTNGGLAITATGAASTNIRWVATVQTSEVIYA